MTEFLSAWWMWLIPLAFIGVVIYAFGPKRKTEFEAEARVPMESDKPPQDKR